MYENDVVPAGNAHTVSGANCGPRKAEKGPPEQAGPAGPAAASQKSLKIYRIGRLAQFCVSLNDQAQQQTQQQQKLPA